MVKVFDRGRSGNGTNGWIRAMNVKESLSKMLKLADFLKIEDMNNGLKRKWLEERGIKFKRLKDNIKGEVIHRYNVGKAEVRIERKDNRYYYVISEPRMCRRDIDFYYKVMYKLYFSLKQDPETAVNYVLRTENGVNPENLKYYVLRDTIGYGVLDVMIKDENVEDISADGVERSVRVFHREFSDLGWLFSNLRFEGEEELDRYASILAHKGGKSVSIAFPVAEGLLPEKHRVMITYRYEVSPLGSSFVIRKPFREPLTLTHLIRLKMLSPLMAAYMWMLLEMKGSVFIAGEMASGKTTLLNALLMLLPLNWKIVTIEVSPEIFLPHTGWKPLTTRFALSANHTPIPEISVFDLVKIALRERADVIVVGEVRGEEARYLAQAIATGHGGATTFHSDSIETMISRLVSPPIEVPNIFLPLFTGTLTRYVKLPGEKPMRRVMKVGEVVNEDGNYVEIFRWDAEKDIFEPDDAGEVVDRSVKLKERGRVIGWTRDVLICELEEKARLLRKLTESGILRYGDVVNEIQRILQRSRS